MSSFRNLFSNTAFLTISHFINRIFNALIVIIVARYLGVEKYGLYSTALALVNVFLIANDIGTTTLLLREGARDEKKIGLYLGNSLIIQIIATLGFFVLTLITAFGLNYSQLTIYLIIILGLSVAIFEFRKSFRGVLRIFLKLKFYSILEILNGVLTFTGIYLVSHVINDKIFGIILIASIQLFFNIILIISLYLYDLKFTKPKYDFAQIKPMIKESYIYSIYNIVYTISFQISTLMVQAYKGDYEAGLYSAASKLIMLFLVIPQMIFQVALPLMFKYSKLDIIKYKKIHQFIFRYLNVLGLPVIFSIIFLADPIMQIIYHKKDYLTASPALIIFAFFLLARILGNVSGQSLTASDQQRKTVLLELSSLTLLIILNIILLPRYGFIGSAVATVISEFYLRISFIILDFKNIKENFFIYLLKLIKPLIAASLMAIFIILIKDYFHVIFVMFSGGVIYCLLLWILRFFTSDDKQLFKQLLPHK